MFNVYKCVFFKFFGEVLMGDDVFGINCVMIEWMVVDIVEVVCFGMQFVVVIGGGNIFCGVVGGVVGMDCVMVDYMGMLVMMMNVLVLQDVMCYVGIEVCVQFVLCMDQVVELYIWFCVICQFEEGCVVIFVVGIGNLFFMMDIVVVLCGLEVGVEVVLKVIKVDGVYFVDLKKDLLVMCYMMISFDEVISCNLQVMDVMVFVLCCDQKLLICVFLINKLGVFKCIVLGEDEGMFVYV